MCGIVGFTGKREAAPILLEGLSKLEYRGYDSAGIAVEGDSGIQVVKETGKLVGLIRKTKDGTLVKGTTGIGHTRWATHGVPSVVNAHPHISSPYENMDNESNVIGVHNGIIENYGQIKDELSENDYEFYSQTDTEIAIKLIDFYYKKDLEPLHAIRSAMKKIRGSYALVLMFKDFPGEIWVARKDSPLIIGIADDETFVASDVPAILNHTRNVYYIDSLEVARLISGKAFFYNVDGEEIIKELVTINFSAQAAEKGGYDHFMLKEIYEQPRAITDTISSAVSGNKIRFPTLRMSDEDIRDLSSISIVACGSAWHAGVVAQHVIENLCNIPVKVALASEFRYQNRIWDPRSLVIIISQSGETADSLAALREAKRRGIRTFAIVNVVGSSIAREADSVFYTLSGPEISVATTKAYSAQLVSLYLLAVYIGRIKGTIDKGNYSRFISEIKSIPGHIEKILKRTEEIRSIALKIADREDTFFVGRGIDYAISLEGSLKLKEISYIHSEAYAAGELKHGTISLIEEGTPVIGVLTEADLFEKTLSNMVECKSRGAKLIAITVEDHTSISELVDDVFFIPRMEGFFIGSLAVIPLQLIAYYISVQKGLDVDKPRNLAKSVTVE